MVLIDTLVMLSFLQHQLVVLVVLPENFMMLNVVTYMLNSLSDRLKIRSNQLTALNSELCE